MPSSSQHAKIPSPSLPRPKTQKADLCRAWTELCMRESQARIRNQQLLQDFAGLEAQLAALAAKTDTLRRRKRDYEELLQRLRGNLPKHQGASRRQDLVSEKCPELLARPLSAEWDGQLPLEMKYQSESSPFPPFDITPTHAPEVHERLGPKFREYKQRKAPVDHPFYIPRAHPARKHGGPDLPSPWPTQRLQKDEEAWFFSGQGRSHSSPSQPWPVPGRRGLCLPEEWLGPVMAQVPEGQTVGSPTASNTFQSKEARRHSILSRGSSAEEHRDTATRREDYHLPCDPAGLPYHLRLHGEAPSCMYESQLGLPLMHSGNNSSGASVSSSAEVISGPGVAERNTNGLPRQQRMKAKPQDANTTMILNEELAHMSRERFPGLLEHEETAIIQGSGKVLREETLPCSEEPGNGELRENEESKISADEGGEATGSLDLGLEQSAEECRSLREGGAQEDEEIRGREGGLEQGQENQGGSNVGEAGTAREGNSLGCSDQGQEDLGENSVGERGQADLGPGSQEGEVVEGERNLQWSKGEGEKSDQEVEEQFGEKTSKPDKSEESQNGVSGDKEGDLECAERSQEEPSHPKKNEEAASTGSSSDEVVIGLQMCVMSEQDNIGDCQTSSVQSEGPLATGAESIGEEEEEDEEEDEDDEEEEESEPDADIEAALAPHSNKSETTRDQQGGTVIPNFQELEADSEEANKDGDLHDKDDFYD